MNSSQEIGLVGRARGSFAPVVAGEGAGFGFLWCSRLVSSLAVHKNSLETGGSTFAMKPVELWEE
jgi:hypothetical protein